MGDIKDKLKFIPSNNPAILGTLEGPCADILNPTRNGRLYNEQAWYHTLYEDELVAEAFENGGLFGELGHPSDRIETLPEKIAICMKERPTKNKDGLLIGRWDILDTPNGRILKTLVDYGYKIGISSRGNGDVIDNGFGESMVEPSSFKLEGFDAVLLPAVKAARLVPVKESLDTKGSLRQALTESLNKATPDDRRIMEETLKDLNIGYDSEMSDNIDSTKTSDSEKAKDTGIELVKSLKEALKDKNDLEKQILELQNKLAVSDTKVNKIEEELNRYKNITINLSKQAQKSKKLSKDVSSLNESLCQKENAISKQKRRIEELQQLSSKRNSSELKLQESLNANNKQLTKLQEEFNSKTKNYESKIHSLTESIEKVTKEKADLQENYQSKLDKSSKLIKKYKALSSSAIESYIDFRANLLGVSSQEITNKLNESYTIKDIDKVCEDLQDYKLSIRRLPFSIDSKTKVKLTESKVPSKKDKEDDDILSFANSLI